MATRSAEGVAPDRRAGALRRYRLADACGDVKVTRVAIPGCVPGDAMVLRLVHELDALSVPRARSRPLESLPVQSRRAEAAAVARLR